MDKSTQQPTVFDTDQQQLGDVYAKALLAFGQQSGTVDTLVDQLNDVASVVRELSTLRMGLESPRVAQDAKFGLIDKAFGDRCDAGLVNFLKVLASKGRFDCLSAAAASASKLRDEAAGRVQAVLTTATEVDEAVVQRVADRLTSVLGKTVSLEAVVDPEVIGGMVIRVGDTVYDGSVVNQLAQVRARAVQQSADAIREQLDRFASTS